MDAEIAKEIEDGLREVSSREVGTITADRRIDEMGLDSVSMAELVFLLEDKMDVILETEELAELETFGELGALIQERRAGSC